ncbi:MAG: hypothetical protein COB46_04390 [Rhodospirillaceae bacterium]|nr:MAG: hypothetical protein COB46_04390 [Rhodospirillaceae bacterium]
MLEKIKNTTQEITLEQAMFWVNKVPNNTRSFDTREDKLSGSGVTPQTLAELEQLGLQSSTIDGVKHFDSYDLSNISLLLGLPSLQRMAMRCWRASLNNARNAKTMEAQIEYKIDPSQLENDQDDLSVLIPNVGRTRTAISEQLWSGAQALHFQPDLPEKLASFIKATLEGVTFFMLHEELRWNETFFLENRLAECGGASKFLVKRAREEGFEARQVFGLILAEPYATPHFWAEFKIDNQWVAVDPLLIRVLRRSAFLSAEMWPEDRSPGRVLLKLSEVVGYEPQLGRPILSGLEDEAFRIDPIVTQGRRDIAASFPTTFSINAD